MDHNLEDALNLESAMVDFDHSEHEVVNQADISLDASGHEETIPMEYEHIEEQSMLMETGNEEIIDFMGDQFTLQGYETQEGEVSAECIKMEPQENVTVSKAGSLLGIQFDEPMSVPASGVINTNEMNIQPKIIAVRAAVPTLRAIAPRREQVVVGKPLLPRQVAIAPKPAATQGAAQALPATVGRQYALAPKPLRAPAKPVTLVAKQALGHTAKGNTVLAIGKQLVVMPSAQKIKLLPGARRLPAADEQAHLIQNVSTSQAQGNKLQKVLVQGSQAELSNQPAVITKLISMGSTQPTQTRYVTMHHKPKTMPITIGNKKVMLASPGAGGLRYPAGSKSQLLAIKPPAPAQAPAQAPALQGITKKVVVRPNPTTHNVVLKAAPSPGIVTSAAPHKTQVHQINVPGKGIQYIRLVSNPTPAVKPVQKPSAPSKTFVLTDGKGNLIQMTTEKVMATQPPPLLLTGNATASKVTSKPPHKLVRLAPVSSKLGQSAMQNRGGQSLLAPLSPTPEEAQPMRVPDPELDEAGQLLYSPDQPALQQPDEYSVQEEEIDSKAALRALIADTVGSEGGDDEQHNTSTDIDVELERTQGREYSDSNGGGAAAGDHPLIVIPPYSKQDPEPPADNYESSQLAGGLINVELDVGGAYDYQPARPDIDMVGAELGLLTRKACNCTKSQCLKLYCDCFANGEFCNNCHCNNCHNNLDNEELRQKAIRGCLDRNPNAFRPKIGKSKAGGPDNLRRHNKGCNCKRSGCLKNYCECYEAKIACTNICKCVGCRNVEDSLERARRREPPRAHPAHPAHPALAQPPRHARPPAKQPCSFMTSEVIEAVCQCLLAAAVEGGGGGGERDAVGDVIDEFARCLQDIIGASHHAALLDEAPA